MVIRNMEITDYNEIDKLIQQVHSLHVENRPDLYIELEHPLSKSEFEELVKKDDGISIVAEENEVVIGLCIVSIRSKSGMIDKKVAYMDDLCVDKNFRGQGIGKELFNFASDIAKKKGAERLDLMVWSFNKRAINFYEELGMKPQRYILEKEL